MTVLLKALRGLAGPQRDEVIVPAYTCYSVAASVIKAGLRPRLVDVSPGTLDYEPVDLANADFSRVLAVVATNLYGYPSDLPSIQRVARAHGAFVIDDAAQAMGAEIGGRPSGTWGDAGLFSFDKGKNVSAIEGGVIVTNSEPVARAVASEMASLGRPRASAVAAGIVKALTYWALLRPSLYWIPRGIPQLQLGTTRFTTGFEVSRPQSTLLAVALTMIERLEVFAGTRTENAERYISRLKGVPGVRTVRPLPATRPAYLRFPVLLDGPEARGRILEALDEARLGAAVSYPASLADVPDLAHTLANREVTVPGGRYIADRLLTLPTHPYVVSDDVDRIAATLSGLNVPTSVPAAAAV